LTIGGVHACSSVLTGNTVGTELHTRSDSDEAVESGLHGADLTQVSGVTARAGKRRELIRDTPGLTNEAGTSV